MNVLYVSIILVASSSFMITPLVIILRFICVFSFLVGWANFTSRDDVSTETIL